MSENTVVAPQLDLRRPKVSFGRLLVVEFRKSFDTRVGRWLPISVGLITALIALLWALILVAGTASGVEGTPGLADIPFFGTILWAVVKMLGFGLPLIPILLVTQEWGQRTGLVTFAIEPRRHRVILAKFIASLFVVVLVAAFAVAMAAAITGLTQVITGTSLYWNVQWEAIAQYAIILVISFVVAFGFATLMLNSPAAIGSYLAWALVLPPVAGALTLIPGIGGKLPIWFSIGTTLNPWLSTHYIGPTDLAGLMVSLFLWVVLPLGLGFWRIMRIELK